MIAPGIRESTVFEASRLKIKRANKHIADFNETFRAFAESEFYGFVIERNPNANPDGLLVFRFLVQPPEDLALILGDAIHCLRSALDIAYVELVKAVGAEPTKFTLLKIYESRDKLVQTLRKGVLEGRTDVVDMLADRVKAYQGGNVALVALHNLDIEDKHRLLIPLVSVSAILGMHAAVKVGGLTMNLHNCHLTVSSNDRIELAQTPFSDQKVDIKDKGKSTTSVAFGDGTGLEGQPILPTLHQFAQLVEGIISLFEHTLKVRK